MRTTKQTSRSDERERAQAQYRRLSTTQCAEIADVGDDKVRAWIASGELCALNIGTEKKPEYRVRREDLQALLDRRTVNPEAAA